MWPSVLVLICFKSNKTIPLEIDISTRPNPFDVLCKQLEPYIDPVNGMLYSTSQDKAVHIVCRLRDKYKYPHVELPSILECNLNRTISSSDVGNFMSQNNKYQNMIMLAYPKKVVNILNAYQQIFHVSNPIQIDDSQLNYGDIIIIDKTSNQTSILNSSKKEKNA